MSVPCKIEASPWGLLVGASRVVPDGGGADEQGGTLARRYPRARRPRRAAGGRGRLAPGAERAAGLPPAPTVPGRGCFRPRLAPARAAEQPPAAGVGPRGRARGRARALRRLRPDARGREAGGAARHPAVAGDAAAVDGRGRPGGAAQGVVRAGPAVWGPRRARRGRPPQPRHRRDCLGEPVRIDGCEHAWFEDRGPPCTLLVFVDDATSRLMHLRFVPAESAFAYMAATRAYVETHGKPVAFYSDKHGVFRANHP